VFFLFHVVFGAVLVWISTDQGRDWQLMAGISTGGRSGNARAGGSAAGSSFSPDVSAPAFTLDSFYNIYRISGALGNNGGCLDAVWASMNGGAAWNNQYNLPGSTRHIEPTRELAAAIGDSRGNIFVSGGRSCTANSGEALNDVWMSADKGVNWFRQTASAPWGARLVHQMLSHTSKILNKDVLIVLTGWTGNTDLNDVSISLSFSGSLSLLLSCSLFLSQNWLCFFVHSFFVYLNEFFSLIWF